MTSPKSDRDSALERLPFLSRLEPSLRDLVVGLFQSRSFAFGETIVAQGDTADGMYVLVSGSAAGARGPRREGNHPRATSVRRLVRRDSAPRAYDADSDGEGVGAGVCTLARRRGVRRARGAPS